MRRLSFLTFLLCNCEQLQKQNINQRILCQHCGLWRNWYILPTSLYISSVPIKKFSKNIKNLPRANVGLIDTIRTDNEILKYHYFLNQKSNNYYSSAGFGRFGSHFISIYHKNRLVKRFGLNYDDSLKCFNDLINIINDKKLDLKVVNELNDQISKTGN